MEKKIDELNKCIFKYTLPKLILSQDKIDINVTIGEVYEGSIIIKNSENSVFKGVVYSSHEMVRIKDATFSGIINEIKYTFNSKQAIVDENIAGSITIVSDCGEIDIPYNFKVLKRVYDSSMGIISDLKSFTELAEYNEQEALSIFNSPQFDSILINKDTRNRIIYKSLIRGNSKKIAMEEFLTSTRMKTPVEISIQKNKYYYEVSRELIKDTLIIEKNTWGHCELFIKTETPFIKLGYGNSNIDSDCIKIGCDEDNSIDQNDNTEDESSSKSSKTKKSKKQSGYEISFSVNPKFLKRGINHGKIVVQSISGVYEVNITCAYSRIIPNEYNNYKIKKYNIDYINKYIEFRNGRIQLQKYLEDTELIVQKLSKIQEPLLNELFRIHLQIMSGNDIRAQEMLDELEDRLDSRDEVDNLIRCGYLYLKTLISKDKEFMSIAHRTISEQYKQTNSWQAFWILLYIDKKYDNNYTLKIQEIKKQFDNGCISPVMYYEACAMFNKDYTLLKKLGKFEKHVMNFGAKKNIVNEEAILAYASLASRLKEFDFIVYNTLKRFYDFSPQKEVLNAICSILIKGEKYNNRYFKWYKLGVDQQLKLTQLYESFMYAYDEESNEQFSESLLIYFSFNSNMSDSKKAFLYANVIRNKEKAPLTYDAYLKQIKPFMRKQLKQHIINENMKIIYEDLLNEDTIDEEIAKELPYIMFRQDIICYNPNFVGVVVVHKVLSIEQYVSFKDGRAQVNIFGSGTELFLIDKEGNRYARSNSYTLKKLLNSDKFIEKCFELNPTDGMMIVYLGDKIDNCLREDVDGKRIKKKLIDVPHLREEYKTKYLYELIRYTYDNGEIELLDYYLEIIDISKMHPKERSYVIEYMILRGFRDKAMEAIINYGYSNIPVKRLLKLATKSIGAFDDKKTNEIVLEICAHTFFNGKYDENILNYLVENYYGSTKEMYQIWKSAYEFQVDTNKIEERLIVQILFADSYIADLAEVFRSYYKNHKNSKVIKAFLNYRSYKYIVHNMVLDENIFKIIEKELSYEFNEMYTMALLKKYSFAEDLTFKELTFVDKTIKYFSNKNIVLPFFKKFADKIELIENIADKYYVEYTTDPSIPVIINYSILESTSDKFEQEIMRDVFYGIRVKEFILFYGDNLQYYVVEQGKDERVLTESVNLDISDSWLDEESRYNKINLMLLTRAMNDEKTLIEIMKGLTITDYIADNISTPL